jgi:hypothetical protein
MIGNKELYRFTCNSCASEGYVDFKEGIEKGCPQCGSHGIIFEEKYKGCEFCLPTPCDNKECIYKE